MTRNAVCPVSWPLKAYLGLAAFVKQFWIARGVFFACGPSMK